MKTYNFYATLLDAFQRYIDAESIWEKYFSEKMSFNDYEIEAKNELLNTINRVPFESEAADKGTAFNELVDCINNKISDKIKYSENDNFYYVEFKNYSFTFDKLKTDIIANKVKNAIPQYFCTSEIKINDCVVNLYGYIDELMPFSIIDIKTTSKYEAFKYRKNWQHKVYTYCLKENNVDIDNFTYLVAELTTNSINIHEELYFYTESYKNDIIIICEKLIQFIESNRNLITDNKIFNKQ